eukprot:CCRYP_015444-RA/>CCRYP_015444-RA protein AED:0.57 eAED:0.43 QI:0/0/0/0.5/1/1/2/0/381
MIGFSPLPHRVFEPPLVANPHTAPMATTTSSNQGLKRLASSREELERSWHSSAVLLHSISGSRDSLDDEAPPAERTFKRQRTLDSTVNAMTGVSTTPTPAPEYSSLVDRMRIRPDNRPPPHPTKDDTSHRPPPKAGWYHGHLDAMGNRHGIGHTLHDDGTEYDGTYVHDVMEGWGRYKFTTVQQLVSFPQGGKGGVSSTTLHRVTERVFEGVFEGGTPRGRGVMISTVVDSLPPSCVAAVTSMTDGMEVQYVKVVYDVGYYREDGRAVGEGARFTYSKSTSMNEWEEVCTRTWNGECSGVKVGRSYGEWVCDCLNLQSYPESWDSSTFCFFDGAAVMSSSSLAGCFREASNSPTALSSSLITSSSTLDTGKDASTSSPFLA